MNAIAIVIVLSLFGLILYFDKRNLLFRRMKTKRSRRDRRKSFIASKNQMRRSGKDRRQYAG